MPPLAYFGIESSGFSLAVNLLILFLVVLYFSLIYWTFQDARRRIADPVMIGLATFVACFPFVGAIVYMILRPPEYLEDVRERDLELQTAEARLAQVQRGQCPYCDYRIERDFVRCPELPAQAQGALRQLLASARPGVDDLSLLRGRRAGDHRPAGAPTARRGRRGGPVPALRTGAGPRGGEHRARAGEHRARAGER